MLSLITSPLGKIAGIALLLAALWGGFEYWLSGHDAAVKEKLVSYYEAQAAEAKAAEIKRQADAAKAATDSFQKQLDAAKASESKAQTDLEREIASYEKQLSAAKRDCLLDDDDVSRIVHNGNGAAKPVGHH